MVSNHSKRYKGRYSFLTYIKPAFLVLAFLFFFQLITPVALAQDGTVEESLPLPPAEEPAPVLPPAGGSISDPEAPAELAAVAEEDNLVALSLTVTSRSPVDLGKPPVGTGFKISADTSDGSLAYEFPLTLPPGRQGLAPELSLLYSSRPTSATSLFGYGWTLSIPFIERKNLHGSDRLYEETDFTSSLSGDLVALGGETYRAKVDEGEFLVYVFRDNAWTVTDKSGMVYRFGQTAAARQDDADHPTHVYKWMLEEVRDLNGNYVTYRYAKDSNQIYPESITYTHHADTAGLYSIRFIKTPRDYPVTSWAAGFKVVTNHIISEIVVEVGGGWTRKYSFAYTQRDNQSRSLLTSIIEWGNDGSKIISLPPTTFTYQVSAKAWVENSRWTLPVSLVGDNYEDTGARIADINGDALPDIITNNNGSFLNTGYGDWDRAGPEWTLPVALTKPDVVHPGSMLIDVNGDGLIDIAQSRDGDEDPDIVYFNTGHGWVTSSTTVPVYFATRNGSDNGVRVADINGDGLPDLLRFHAGDGALGNRVYINNGSGWSEDRSWVLPEPTLAGDGQTDLGTRFGDVNGDGLVDILRKDESVSKVYFNTGHGWELASAWVITAEEFMNDGGDRGTRVYDVNSDGFDDLVNSQAPGDVGVYLNTGSPSNDWTLDMSWRIPFRLVDYLRDGGRYVDPGTRLVDLNADGLLDILQSRSSGPNQVYFQAGPQPDLLQSVTFSRGGGANITYLSSTFYHPNGLGRLNQKLPFPMITVSTITEHDGLGGSATTEYSYKNGEYYHENILDRKFAGFGQVEKTDAMGNITKTYFHQGNDSDSGRGEFEDHFSKIGRIYRVEKYDSAGNLLTQEISRWGRVALAVSAGLDRSFVPLLNNIKMTYDGDNSHRDVAEAYTYDNFGNLVRAENYGEVVASDDGSFSDLGSDKTTKILSYVTNSTTGILGLVRMEELRNNNGANVAVKKYYYDNLPIGAVQRGNLTKTESWVGGTKWVTTANSYDNQGLLKTSTDGRGYSTTYLYDEFGLYPSTISNSLGQVTSYQYDYASGQVTKETDPNGFAKIKIYDGLGRVVTEKEQTGGVAEVVTKETFYRDDIVPKLIQTKKFLLLNLSNEVYSYFDGLGRLVEERTQMENAGDYAVTSLKYNPKGELLAKTLPYLETGSSYTAPTFPVGLTTNFTYDSLGRAKTVSDSLGTTNYSYTDWVTTITDPLGKVKKYTTDAYGRLILVDEGYGKGFYHTRYYYSPTGNLIRIMDALNNIRDFTYDNLGRRLSAQDLHQSSDTSFGLWSYTYDDNNNLFSRKDPLGQTVNYTYDGLNRPLIEDYLGRANPEVKYTYDNCINGVGRLCKVAIVGLSKNYQYTPRGEVRVDNRVYNQASYTTVNAYDLAGNIVSIRLPDNSQIIYEYNLVGKVENISRRDIFNSSAIIPVVSNFDYSPHGLPVYQQNADGIKNIFTYDPTKSYRLQTKTTKKDNINYQLVSYEYDSVGNITKLIDTSPNLLAKTVSYTYDDLYRLTKAVATNASSTLYSQDFLYGPTGNILKGSMGIYAYSGIDFTSPQAVTSIASSTYSYDKNGNMLTAPSATYAWDYNNRLVKSVAGTTTTTYEYDNEGQRISQKTGASATLYISPNYDLTGSVIDKHVYAGDQLVATLRTQNGTTSPYYTHSDHLSGTSLVTDQNSNVMQSIDYLPYGAKRISSGTDVSQREFIGQIYDELTSLSYLNARYYDGSRGQFLSQDPMFWQLPSTLLVDPQQLNSYSYARNNPLIYKDPLGLYNIKTGAVEKGDNLSKIRNLINGANGTSYSVSQLAKLNNISNPDRIYVGQTIKPNNLVPDITRSLNSVNQSHGVQAQGPVVAGSGSTNSTPAAKGIGSVEFGWNFREGGKWDLKSQGSNVEGGVFCQKSACGGQRATSYIYNSQEVSGDAPGNIHYGYVGKRAEYSESTLLFFGGAVQTITHPGQFGDPSSDKTYIMQGYGLNY
ncbi:MAG: hypothetical protein A2571_01535 [Candidatus Vogelbacteria bacterium RIFOXYD1_FULL_44_32]|uniref:LysM domain-containing protein n=1 Tax=Candidatus Vogelbacteria bacterium RIFOXYD1_FULL_44_32 TaxID=1802438 RepID=A0A1G2QDD6_9BACT|nr:MAG: hypothetical protein A2571_01535 [Candidatus Vogelbacteria bacterium RIFOXYD1_FULL_44_32]